MKGKIIEEAYLLQSIYAFADKDDNPSLINILLIDIEIVLKTLPLQG